MTLGLAVMASGAAIRVGAISLGPGVEPGIGPGVGGDVGTAAPNDTAGPVEETPPAGGSSADGELWFADDFTAEGPWQTGDLGLMQVAVASGRYTVEAQPADLPLVVMAAAGEGAPGGDGRTVTIEVTVNFASGDAATSAGLVVADAAGRRLMLLVARGGDVGLFSDTIESFDLLASASVEPQSGTLTLAMRVEPSAVTVLLDGAAVTSAAGGFEIAGVGLAVWSPMSAATIEFQTYRVWSAPAS
jgi:hypothetical protein